MCKIPISVDVNIEVTYNNVITEIPTQRSPQENMPVIPQEDLSPGMEGSQEYGTDCSNFLLNGLPALRLFFYTSMRGIGDMEIVKY